MTKPSFGVAWLFVLSLFFITVGIVALAWPEKIQEYVMNFYSQARGLTKLTPFLKWMQTSAYPFAPVNRGPGHLDWS